MQAALGGALAQGAAGRADVRRALPAGRRSTSRCSTTARGDGARTLPGVRERVSLYGGQLHAGRRRNGGHAVRAKLPVGSAS